MNQNRLPFQELLIVEQSQNILSYAQGQILLFALHHHPFIEYFNRYPIPFIFWDSVEPMTRPFFVQIIELPLLRFIQLFKDMIAAGLFVDYSITLFPTNHHMPKAVCNRLLSNPNQYSSIIRNKKAHWQTPRYLFVTDDQLNMIRGHVCSEVCFEMLEYGGVIDYWIVVVINRQYQRVWAQEGIDRLLLRLLYLQVAQEFAFREHCIAHYGQLRKQYDNRDVVQEMAR